MTAEWQPPAWLARLVEQGKPVDTPWWEAILPVEPLGTPKTYPARWLIIPIIVPGKGYSPDEHTALFETQHSIAEHIAIAKGVATSIKSPFRGELVPVAREELMVGIEKCLEAERSVPLYKVRMILAQFHLRSFRTLAAEMTERRAASVAILKASTFPNTKTLRKVIGSIP